ncbi:MAG: pantoate--beta-alanine ligase [Candidatus Meridianibacter frigidus]|nr:MAG: pantoate--beta-alanine ligase [Candidatus Eremiobacteraeota bacterium]
MITHTQIPALRSSLGSVPRPLGFVPTMGALHDGHLALLRDARNASATVAASVFVNPLQFAAGEDFERYPRDRKGDAEKLAASGVDVLFAPSAQNMYSSDFATSVDVGRVGAGFEGAVRPGHFRGVATVVAKLLNIVQPDVLFVGQKDAQQTAVLARMIDDLNFPVALQILPTVRESDGLALSSRNTYLSSDERAAAPSLHTALESFEKSLREGVPKPRAAQEAAAVLRPPGTWDYLDIVSQRTFEPIEALTAPAFIIGAACFGRVRLIDNLWISA